MINAVLIFFGMAFAAMVLPALILWIQDIIVNILEYRLEVYRIAANMEATKNEKDV